MTTEFVLLLGLYAFIVIGAFLGDKGPMATFKKAGPRFAAKVERDTAVGWAFQDKIKNNGKTLLWSAPEDNGAGGP